jgi:hypothetical protein
MTEPTTTGRRRARRAGAILAWLAVAALATFASSLAVGAIGSGIVPQAEQPLGRDEVDRRLAEFTPTTSTPPPIDTTTSTTSEPPRALPEPEVIGSQGGTVLARCTPAVEVVSALPAQGYGVKDIEPEDGGRRVRFESGRTRVEVTVTCPGGQLRSSTRVH